MPATDPLAPVSAFLASRADFDFAAQPVAAYLKNNSGALAGVTIYPCLGGQLCQIRSGKYGEDLRDGIIRVRRSWCQACQRTVSLLPEFVLPYLPSSLTVDFLYCPEHCLWDSLS